MTTLLILSGFYIIWLAALLTVAYTPRLFHNYTLFKAINSILFVVISVLAWRHSGMNMFTYWPLLAAFCLAAFGDIAIGVANNRHGAAGASHSISGMAGVGFFSIAHVFYLLFFTQFCPMEWYHFILPIIAMLAMLRITRHPSFHFSRHTRPAGIFYYMVVTLMFSVGLNVAVTCVTWSPLLSIRCPLNGWALGAGVTLFLVSDLLMLPLYFYTRRKCPRCASSISPPTILDSSCWHSASYCKPAIHISSAPCYGSLFLFFSTRDARSASPSGRFSAALRTALARSAGAPPLFHTKKRVPLIGTLSFI